MGNLLVCFKSSDQHDHGQNEEYDSFGRAAYLNEDDPSSEEKVERRGSVFPPSPSAYRSSLGPSSIIPPYVVGTSSGRSSTASGRRATQSFSPMPGDQTVQKKAKEVRILLLGSGESGKSTITKQMKIIHQNGYSREELISFRPAVYRNIKVGMEQVIKAAQSLQLDEILAQCEEQIRVTKEADFDPETAICLPKEFIDAVNYIWLEGGVKSIYDQLSHASYVYDSASLYENTVDVYI